MLSEPQRKSRIRPLTFGRRVTIQHDWDRTEAVGLPALPRPGFVATDHPDDERHVGMTLGKRVFDVVLALEIVEHVADPQQFLTTCARLLRPGGMLVASTLNRTPQSFAAAIVGAEWVMRWLPRGTHEWRRFIRPDELAGMFEAAGVRVVDRAGMVFNPLGWSWSLSRRDLAVNYLMAGVRG